MKGKKRGTTGEGIGLKSEDRTRGKKKPTSDASKNRANQTKRGGTDTEKTWGILELRKCDNYRGNRESVPSKGTKCAKRRGRVNVGDRPGVKHPALVVVSEKRGRSSPKDAGGGKMYNGSLGLGIPRKKEEPGRRGWES